MTRIRAATHEDVEAVVEMERAVFGSDAWSASSVQSEFADLHSRDIVVAVSGDEVIGYGVQSRAGDISDLRRLAVAPDARRHGIATTMLRDLVERARSLACQRCLIEVAADNEAALAFYSVAGFVEISRRPQYYSSGMDAVVMALELTT
ncbi:MAG TPA: ribosomal protein S18-alanine N-acetyltransferase [Nocardioidaceae bacterium]|nr:ribosomal protein S18-alanine N-acetyltransferase [Nocardioidaceae bacterium]